MEHVLFHDLRGCGKSSRSMRMIRGHIAALLLVAA